ncbi:MAG: hypothetical protein HYU29_05595 [Chloroflexi bacterium]|nr:hypothetical protein [Chloroflexota bacterium]
MLTIGWFSTGRGTGSRGLLTTVQEAILRGELEATIQFVFSNREPGEHEGSDEFFRLVGSYGIPLVTHSSMRFRRQRGREIPWPSLRNDYHREVMKRLEGFSPDVCALAGYMLITGPEMCRRYRMLNLHPALPEGPTGTWQEVIWRLIEERAAATGVMVHLATEEVDQGPPITYVSFPIQGGVYEPLWRVAEGIPVSRLKESPGEELSLFKRIREEGVKRERPLLLETLAAVASGRVPLPLPSSFSPLCLNAEVRARLEQD